MSTPPLFFVDHLPDAPTMLLSGPEGHHAARVRRVEVGEAVRVADGLGAVADCRVASVGADEVTLEVRALAQVHPREPAIVVVQALAKGDRAELAVELLTEFGVDEIVPWAAARSVVQWRDERTDRALARWRRTAREAAKQSRRPLVPRITNLASTAQVAQRIAGTSAFVLHEQASTPLASLAAALPASGQILLVVGPEGGVAPDEIETFIAAGARLVRLGDPVLRTSSAGAAAVAVLSGPLGRWSGG